LNGIHLLVATNGCTTGLGVGKVVGNLADELVHTRNIANERAQYIPAVYQEEGNVSNGNAVNGV
jgi:hypothetical protein